SIVSLKFASKGDRPITTSLCGSLPLHGQGFKGKGTTTMMAEKVLSRSVRLMFAGGMALGAGMAHAQDQSGNAPLQRVEVTGSRIPSLNTEGSSPITTLSAKDIKADGPKNTEDLLNNMPSVFAT